METAPLKSFATWARRELITQVSARLTAVLAPSSAERVENQRAVAMLERDIAAAGGRAKGKDAIADKVAYTWFNRIIALRFMDANGYTGIGVVSPAHGQQVGQPEILADAKRGSIDPAVITNKRTLDAITGLLDGTRPSADAQGEAYTLLLAEYCRYWNRSMPFMFEREGDYTELLIPANLLAADSILTRAIAALTEEVCREVEVIGWLYQFYISERKEEIFAGFKKGKKAGAAEIPAATQLFTPHWIVRYLVENSVGRLWMLNHPSSRLVDQMDYYIASVDDESDFLKITSPEELTVIDPACGSGHMLTYAFDLLYAIYEEEGYAPSEIPELILTRNLHGTEIDPRAGALAAFALTMKARNKQRTFLSKQVAPSIGVIQPVFFTPEELEALGTLRPGRDAEAEFWNQFELAETFGALVQPDPSLRSRLESHIATLNADADILLAELVARASRVLEQATWLSRKYSTVIANPPYMGSGKMARGLLGFLEERFPETKADLFSAFMQRVRGFVPTGGFVGMVTPNVWMYLKSHAAVRSSSLLRSKLVCLVELPLAGFTGATVQLCAFVLAMTPTPRASGHYVSLLAEGSGDARMSEVMRAVSRGERPEIEFVRDATAFLQIPGRPLAYRASDDTLAILAGSRRLGDVATTRKGMATGLNAVFVREWWEVSHRRVGLGLTREEALRSGKKWFPYANGGDFRKWYGHLSEVVDWADDGARLRSERTPDGSRLRAVNLNLEFVFDQGVSWTSITSGRLAFRVLPRGSLFSSASNALFTDEPRLKTAIAVLNSPAAAQLMSHLNPTLNANPGDIARMPLPDLPTNAHGLVDELVAAAADDDASNETSWQFRSLLDAMGPTSRSLRGWVRAAEEYWRARSSHVAATEGALNRLVGGALGDPGREGPLALEDVTLARNPDFAHKDLALEARGKAWESTLAKDLVSYAVGCMFGRYSLDEPGLILADQGATLQDYLAKVPQPTFAPDADNVLPIVDGDWFEDDIVARFRQFLRAAFGEEYFEENLRFVEESLGVKALREYFVSRAGRSRFYDDHVKRYKKRPIYWLFSSPKGSFNALIYMHRYAPSTVSTVLNEYLREFESKLEANLQHQERLAAGDGTPREKAAALKEAERLRKVLLELGEYEHDVLYPLASQQIAIDLDDGVKVNYPRFYPALKKITGLEAADE
ncbi:BREX-1 system adenine-specific DNA-methyltransferase PglX [Microbacterium sp. gxy059]|uniref:BREX-1 system adenine-specific DNA-methyltransferase PglX n=1 Tax=Microbacterium sp. gxy059 TaxID=2957199 RepID=UPI003D994534